MALRQHTYHLKLHHAKLSTQLKRLAEAPQIKHHVNLRSLWVSWSESFALFGSGGTVSWLNFFFASCGAFFCHPAIPAWHARQAQLCCSFRSDCAKPCAEVIRSGDLISYTGEEGLRRLGEGKMLVSDSYPGQDRSKICLSQKVALLFRLPLPLQSSAVS